MCSHRFHEGHRPSEGGVNTYGVHFADGLNEHVVCRRFCRRRRSPGGGADRTDEYHTGRLGIRCQVDADDVHRLMIAYRMQYATNVDLETRWHAGRDAPSRNGGWARRGGFQTLNLGMLAW